MVDVAIIHHYKFSMQDYRKNQEPEIEKRKEPVLDDISKSLTERYGLNFTRQQISSLWFLCKQVILHSYTWNMANAEVPHKIFRFKDLENGFWNFTVNCFVLGYALAK